MATKLSKEKNLALKGFSPQERLAKITDWYLKGEISQGTFNMLCLKENNKESNKKLNAGRKAKRTQPKSSEEIKMTEMRHKLNARLKSYLITRNLEEPLMNYAEFQDFKSMINLFPLYQEEINKLLEVALRYPEPALVEIAFCFIVEKMKEKGKKNKELWKLLWSSSHLVPLDVIRLMYDEDGDNIDEYFDKNFLKDELLPLIEIQRDKEITRLNTSKNTPVHNCEEAISKCMDIERKTKRLNAFNNIILKISK
ncbi:MAG: hypothetical protein IKL33_01315 [Alphaproteobacteria bacterium]|nr:hypothetical protein [Alphaproteobacteria bacterium]